LITAARAAVNGAAAQVADEADDLRGGKRVEQLVVR
jgi:hypothetical protein